MRLTIRLLQSSNNGSDEVPALTTVERAFSNWGQVSLVISQGSDIIEYIVKNSRECTICRASVGHRVTRKACVFPGEILLLFFYLFAVAL